MITRESIIKALSANFVSMLSGQEKLRLHPHLCEDYYLLYQMHDGVLYCYELRDGVKYGGRISELTNGKLYKFVDALISLLVYRANGSCQYAIGRELEQTRKEIHKALFN